MAETEFTLFPEGTEITMPEDGAVTFFFPDPQDAIIFFQFWQAFANGEYALFVQEQ